MRIGLLADTHVPYAAKQLPQQVLDAFAEVAMILHAGDHNTLAVLDPLHALGEVHAVAGNTDPFEVARVLPEAMEVVAAGVRIGLTHGHFGPGKSTLERARRQFPSARVVVFGHSHQPLVQHLGRQLLVNPGSPTDRRAAPRCSCAILTIDGDQVSAELVTW